MLGTTVQTRMAALKRGNIANTMATTATQPMRAETMIVKSMRAEPMTATLRCACLAVLCLSSYTTVRILVSS